MTIILILCAFLLIAVFSAGFVFGILYTIHDILEKKERK